MSMNNVKKRTPKYQDVDGFRIPAPFCARTFRSALAYKPRPDDLIIATYPKCGTTWMQTIVECIIKEGGPLISTSERMSAFLEVRGSEAMATLKRPKAIKTHLPYHMLPQSTEAKYIFVARNPKDCCVAYYHHTKNFPGYDYEGGEFDDYFELFIEGEVDYGDYFDTLLPWYEHRNDPNVLFITYEQLKEDIVTCVRKIAEFMGTQYKDALENNDQAILKAVVHHSSFGFMKQHINKHFAELAAMPKEMMTNNPDIPHSLKKLFTGDGPAFNEENVTFVRKGIVGDWRNYFSPEQNARMMKKYYERTAGTDISNLWKHCM